MSQFSNNWQDRDNFDNTGSARQQPYDDRAPPGAQGNTEVQGNVYDPDNSGRQYQQDYQGSGQTAPGVRDPYSQQMPSGNTGPIYQDDNDDFQSRQTGATGGTGTKLAGKAEAAFGSLIGSQNLKAKGLEKEAGANAGNMQGFGANPENVGLGARQGHVPQGAGTTGGYSQ